MHFYLEYCNIHTLVHYRFYFQISLHENVAWYQTHCNDITISITVIDYHLWCCQDVLHIIIQCVYYVNE